MGSEASDLVLHCLLISHKMDVMLIWVNISLLSLQVLLFSQSQHSVEKVSGLKTMVNKKMELSNLPHFTPIIFWEINRPLLKIPQMDLRQKQL